MPTSHCTATRDPAASESTSRIDAPATMPVVSTTCIHAKRGGMHARGMNTRKHKRPVVAAATYLGSTHGAYARERERGRAHLPRRRDASQDRPAIDGDGDGGRARHKDRARDDEHAVGLHLDEGAIGNEAESGR